jgi:hypothetical protein
MAFLSIISHTACNLAVLFMLLIDSERNPSACGCHRPAAWDFDVSKTEVYCGFDLLHR